MGCDIHAYIEYWEKGNQNFIQCFSEVELGRDYHLFGILAGVRDAGAQPIVAPRGIPTNLSYLVDREYHLDVIDKEETDSEYGVTRKQADDWMKTNSVVLVDTNKITHPDWHTPSWLTCDELMKALERYAKECYDEEGVYHSNLGIECAVSVMKVMEIRGLESRLTFWFDS